jgi:hypothetical protein
LPQRLDVLAKAAVVLRAVQLIRKRVAAAPKKVAVVLKRVAAGQKRVAAALKNKLQSLAAGTFSPNVDRATAPYFYKLGAVVRIF